MAPLKKYLLLPIFFALFIVKHTFCQTNLFLKVELDSIYKEDQVYRMADDSVKTKFGINSTEYQSMMLKLAQTDSNNVKRIKEIIAQYGWPGKTMVGEKGNATVFLVVQHSNIETQKTYLPFLRESVQKGESKGTHLAYLEDRIAIREGRKQVYGTQMAIDKETGKYYVNLLEDPDNVDKRRAQIRLNSIAEYIKQWGVEWDLQKFKNEQNERIKIGVQKAN